ncbi:hypothetical protein HYH03_008833 [Edaphochlamys debaryana]|uniref:Uncharacterized protein n=1 Tax=Edaphochlamys debaryana TaxID=47281 RepID=A0A835Y5L4_9CHLO|nr:hypothetical protein HYH03_008833 [Edaphochlamys debaryana]|eukprot:KAG2492920.1 hypothetical protein HYH03_008833 [Edaphochlamys debaryana]
MFRLAAWSKQSSAWVDAALQALDPTGAILPRRPQASTDSNAAASAGCAQPASASEPSTTGTAAPGCCSASSGPCSPSSVAAEAAQDVARVHAPSCSGHAYVDVISPSGPGCCDATPAPANDVAAPPSTSAPAGEATIIVDDGAAVHPTDVLIVTTSRTFFGSMSGSAIEVEPWVPDVEDHALRHLAALLSHHLATPSAPPLSPADGTAAVCGVNLYGGLAGPAGAAPSPVPLQLQRLGLLDRRVGSGPDGSAATAAAAATLLSASAGGAAGAVAAAPLGLPVDVTLTPSASLAAECEALALEPACAPAAGAGRPGAGALRLAEQECWRDPPAARPRRAFRRARLAFLELVNLATEGGEAGEGEGEGRPFVAQLERALPPRAPRAPPALEGVAEGEEEGLEEEEEEGAGPSHSDESGAELDLALAPCGEDGDGDGDGGADEGWARPSGEQLWGASCPLPSPVRGGPLSPPHGLHTQSAAPRLFAVMSSDEGPRSLEAPRTQRRAASSPMEVGDEPGTAQPLGGCGLSFAFLRRRSGRRLRCVAATASATGPAAASEASFFSSPSSAAAAAASGPLSSSASEPADIARVSAPRSFHKLRRFASSFFNRQPTGQARAATCPGACPSSGASACASGAGSGSGSGNSGSSCCGSCGSQTTTSQELTLASTSELGASMHRVSANTSSSIASDNEWAHQAGQIARSLQRPTFVSEPILELEELPLGPVLRDRLPSSASGSARIAHFMCVAAAAATAPAVGFVAAEGGQAVAPVPCRPSLKRSSISEPSLPDCCGLLAGDEGKGLLQHASTCVADCE